MTRRPAPLLAIVVCCAACEREAPPRATAIERDAAVAADTPPSPPAASAPTVTPTTTAAATTGDAAVERALRAALDERVRGAAAQVDSLEFSWFSGATADIIRSVSVDADGRAVVDFVDLRAVLPNASSSAGSEALLRELNATVFGVAGVRAVEYRMAGSCEVLGEWLQYGTCLRFDRPAS